MSTAIKEYVVTLKDYNYLEEFYSDMESEGTTKSCVPSRKIECINRRPISRNTHYLLTTEEARLVEQDSRVDTVTLKLDTDILKPKLHSTQTSDWNRSSSITAGEKNYGLYRTQLAENTVQWGSESSNNTETAAITLTATGKNVDIVIIDETVWPDHPEYADRFIEYDWFANHNSTVWPANPNTNYSYSTFSFENNHATHVAAIIAGKTQGWAREANVYNIKHDVGSNGSFIPPEYVMDYVRAFHSSKPINPATGRRNPTLVNNSWGFEVDNNLTNIYTGFTSSTISKIIYRSGEITPGGAAVDTGISGPHTATANIANMVSVAPSSGNRIVTTGIDAGAVTSTTFTNTNRTGLTNAGAPTGSDPDGIDSYDDAYWTLNLPFPITYATQSYQNNIHVSTNSYVTFGSPSFAFYLGEGAPASRKIFVSGGDRSADSLWTGTFGSSPNRTFIVRYEGFEGAYGSSFETTPTIVWEMTFYENTANQIDVNVVSNAAYRAEYTTEELAQYGVIFNNGTSPARNTFIDADVIDAVTEGIIFVGSAGNSGARIVLPADQDYNNYFVDNGLPTYYHRGSSPGSSGPDVICVGSLDSTSQENKNQTSNTGPRVDIYAPGTNITSAVFDSTGNVLGTGAVGAVAGETHLTIDGGFAGLSSVLAQAGRAAISTVEAHGLTNGDIITIDDCSNTEYNVTNAVVAVIDANTISFNILNTGYTNALEILTGTVKVSGTAQKWSGTSMAAAQVSGLVALALEQYPWMNQVDAKNYVLAYAKDGLMFTTGGSYNDTTSLQGGGNKIAFYYKERPADGVLIPKSKQWIRPSSGLVYPRPKIKRK